MLGRKARNDVQVHPSPAKPIWQKDWLWKWNGLCVFFHFTGCLWVPFRILLFVSKSLKRSTVRLWASASLQPDLMPRVSGSDSPEGTNGAQRGARILNLCTGGMERFPLSIQQASSLSIKKKKNISKPIFIVRLVTQKETLLCLVCFTVFILCSYNIMMPFCCCFYCFEL